MQERRLVMLFIPDRYIANLVVSSGDAAGSRVLSLPQIAEIPADVQIARVEHDWQRGAFGFLLSHPSFEIVPDNSYPPALDVQVKMTFVGTNDQAAAQILALRKALDIVDRWDDFPESVRCRADEREFMRQIARDALNWTPPAVNPPGAEVPATHLQLAFQNMSDRNEIKVLAIVELVEGLDAKTWVAQEMDRQRPNMPEGWEWLVCDQTSSYFKPLAEMSDSGTVNLDCDPKDQAVE